MKSEQNGQAKELNRETATLGGGCFWCLEAIFEELQGVDSIESGYAGGWVDNPSYKQVCTGSTGHAEVVQVTYDPREISFREVLEVFFSIHDPTTLNRQGADAGTQYRSAIFYEDDEQKMVANEVIRELGAAEIWSDPIVTEVTPLSNYHRAEDNQQSFYRDNSWQPYCQVVITPKLARFRKKYAERRKPGV
ncbi:MAG: peptide-methionine (S)-S-oxide reductase MsrA [Chloroflexota bacterium]|nr:peptide-methionine (S)-S-oxide reductase MsrA [Chloroflexota bacterium]